MTQADPSLSHLPEHLQIWQESLQWQPSPEQQTLFQAVYDQILKGNQQINLTRITAPAEFWEKHLWDSLSGVSPWLKPLEFRPDWSQAHPVRTVIDIGTGAGFPGLPIAIARPDWQIALLDSTQKKIRFLKELIQAIALPNVQTWADRAEAFAHQLSHREQYDLALVRAVGSAATCAEYALPLVKVGGFAVLYRGQWTEADHHQLTQATHQLGGTILAAHPWQTPVTQGIRHCVYLQKHTLTKDEFPRPIGIPAKHPLAEPPEQDA